MFAHAQAPIRIGIAGGGTDLPAWTKERVGYCLNLAIATYTHAVAIHRPDKLVVASYSQRDVAGAATEIANGLIRESALLHGFEDGFEVHILSEISSRGSGLGVSSSIAVALIACFDQLAALKEVKKPQGLQGPFGIGIIVPNQGYIERIAKSAWTVEIDRLRRPIGRQDHMAAAFGGLRLYRFEKDEATVERTFSEEDAIWVAKHIALLELQDGHDARQILSGVKSSKQLEAAFASVDIAVRAIESRDVKMLGEAISRGQMSKSEIPGAVSAQVASAIRSIQERHGVYGVKIAGAGGGGHLVIVCDSEDMDTGMWSETGSAPKFVKADFRGVRSEGG